MDVDPYEVLYYSERDRAETAERERDAAKDRAVLETQRNLDNGAARQRAERERDEAVQAVVDYERRWVKAEARVQELEAVLKDLWRDNIRSYRPRMGKAWVAAQRQLLISKPEGGTDGTSRNL